MKAAATTEDKQRITAELLMIEADELAKQGAKTNPQVIEKLGQALALWRELGDPFWTASALSRIGSAYENVNLYEKAIEYYERALVSYREVKRRNAEGPRSTRPGSVTADWVDLRRQLKMRSRRS